MIVILTTFGTVYLVGNELTKWIGGQGRRESSPSPRRIEAF